MFNEQGEVPKIFIMPWTDHHSLFFLSKIQFLGKLKFDIKQLKVKKFIKYVWQLVISNSSATLEVPSLRPCFSI